DGAEGRPPVRHLDVDAEVEAVQIHLVQVVADHIELRDGAPLVAVELAGDSQGGPLVLLLQQRILEVWTQALEVDAERRAFEVIGQLMYLLARSCISSGAGMAVAFSSCTSRMAARLRKLSTRSA